MSEIDNGGPAFPVPLNPGQGWQGMAPCDGMTLRDYFAAQVLVVACEENSPKVAAKNAYEYADAMLEARK